MTARTVFDAARAGERWLLAAGPAHHLALLRIAAGVYALGWLAFVTPELLGLGRLDPARFEPVGVAAVLGLGPPSPAVIAGAVVITAAAGGSFVVGWRYTMTAPTFAGGVLLLATLQNSWGKLLHTENLLVLHLLVLAVSPAAHAWSVARRDRGSTTSAYGWPVRVMALATVATYLAAGVSKLRLAGLDWFDPENLRNWVAYDLVRKELFGDPYLPIATPALEHPWLFAPAVLTTLVVELGAPLALAGGRRSDEWARRWAAAAWSMHVAVLAVMSVAFPYHLSGIPLAAVVLAGRATRHRPGGTVTVAPYAPLATPTRRAARPNRSLTMSTIIVRYTPKADRADENQKLVEAVFAELAESDPGGLRYATFRLADGTFVHIADVEGDDNPLASNQAFAVFQDGIGDRCAEGQGPNPQPATLVGEYRFLAD